MTKLKSLLLAGTIAMLPLSAPAYAAPDEAPEAEVVPQVVIAGPVDATEADSEIDVDSEASSEEAKAKMEREMDEAIAIVEKMFDTSDLPPIEPARLTLAQQTTAALIPTGSLEKMIDNLYGKMFKAIMGEMGGQSDLMISIKTGVDSEKIAALDDATKGKIADVFDPHRKERDDQITKVVKPLISEALADMEPPMRDGLAKAYARKFSAAQLGDLNGFLATPTGNLYASEWMAMQADPEVMLAVIKAVPPLITKFIDRAPTIEKDMKDLPKEKALADLDDAELSKLAKLMKVDVKVLKDQRDSWTTTTDDVAMTTDEAMAPDDTIAVAAEDAVAEDAVVDDAVMANDMMADDNAAATDVATDAAKAADDAADAAVEDPAYDRSNWSEADRVRVEELQAAANSANSAAMDAEMDVITKTRERLGTNPSE